jgi:hypothetical protein
MRLYLAGPMTGLPGHNFAAFDWGVMVLSAMGHDVVSPHELSLQEFGTLERAQAVSWEHHLRRDLTALLTCEGVAVLPGWERSRGATLEVTTAASVGLPVCRIVEPENAHPYLEELSVSTATVVEHEAEGLENVHLGQERASTAVLDAPGETQRQGAALLEAARGDRVTDEATGAVKADGGKVRVDLIPVHPLLLTAEVLTFGARKYADRNWEKGFDWSRIYGAALRHLLAWWSGEDNDPETGISHLGHALCCVMFLAEYEHTGAGTDDRPKEAS